MNMLRHIHTKSLWLTVIALALIAGCQSANNVATTTAPMDNVTLKGKRIIAAAAYVRAILPGCRIVAVIPTPLVTGDGNYTTVDVSVRYDKHVYLIQLYCPIFSDASDVWLQKGGGCRFKQIECLNR